jgi:hypothetical protein
MNIRRAGKKEGVFYLKPEKAGLFLSTGINKKGKSYENS